MDIRILSFKKVGKNFDIRHCVQRRTYNYLIPSKFFQSLSNFKEGKMIEGEELKEVLNKLNELVKFYLGTHNFYNFTRGYKQENPQCVRFMVDMNV